MIKKTTNSQDFFTICDKLKEVKNCIIDSNGLFTHMAGNPNAFTYISFDENGEMNGCLVLCKTVDILGCSIFFVLFQWRDSHFPRLQKAFVEFASEQAKKSGVSKIVFTSSRKTEVVERATKEYSFHKAYDVFEKEI